MAGMADQEFEETRAHIDRIEDLIKISSRKANRIVADRQMCNILHANNYTMHIIAGEG